HWFGFSPIRCLFAAIFGLMLWWVSLFHWFHTAGMVSFVAAAYLGLPFAAKLITYISSQSSWSGILRLGFVGALGIFFHPLFPIPIITLTFLYTFFARRTLSWGRVLVVLPVVAVLSLIPNLWWVYSTAYYGRVFSAGGGRDPYQKLVDIDVVWRELLGFWNGVAHGAKVYPLLAFSALWACFRRKPRKEQFIVWAFCGSGLFLIVFAAVGAYFEPIGQLQPNRFAPVGYLLLCLPASVGVVQVIAVVGES